MPHAFSMPAPGFQTIILCGPGSSFPTFTANPDENPKALIPIANRPMVWYPIDFCYRMGVTNITLVAPPSSAPAIEVAMNTNPHLTGLPLPKPDLLAPKDLDQTTGTAHIFRLPEVRAIIKGDFIVLPCDIVCEFGGEKLLEAWMVQEGVLGGVAGGAEGFKVHRMARAGEQGVRRGGLGVWYETKGEVAVRGEETDFIATAPIASGPVPMPKASLLPHISKLVYSVPTDTLNDITEAKKTLPLRHSLIRNHPNIRMLSSHRDAHIYIFPVWVLDMINKNKQIDNIGEDVIGWWAKAGWQHGLGDKLGLREVFTHSKPIRNDQKLLDSTSSSDDIDCSGITTTWTSDLNSTVKTGPISGTVEEKLTIPPILSYIHSSRSASDCSIPLLRRVDTAPLLLAISLRLAKLESIEQADQNASPLAHARKVVYPAGIASKTTVTRPDCLLADNVTVEEKCAIKECVIGANCQIKQGAKLTKCLLMDGVVVGKGCRLTGCILGRRSEIGEESVLLDCEVQENLLVESRTEDKNAKMMSSKGMEATEQEIQELDNQGSIMEMERAESLASI